MPAPSSPRAAGSVAEATRHRVFPPLMLDPIDFAQMFQQKMAKDQAKAKVQVGSIRVTR